MSALDDTHRVLGQHALPLGLLPDTLTEARIDEASGAFSVTLPAEVRATFGGYRVRYGTTVSGRLEPGAVQALKGVSAKKGPLWFPVTRIVAEGAELVFHVGPVTKRLPRSEFES